MAALHDAPTLVIADPSTQETQDATLVMETQEQQAHSASQAEEPQANGASQAEEPQANGASSALQTNPAGEASVASGDADEQGVQDVQKAIVNFACYHKQARCVGSDEEASDRICRRNHLLGYAKGRCFGTWLARPVDEAKR